jgi:CopG family transcriptional regulator, nickel-responsive regulator
VSDLVRLSLSIEKPLYLQLEKLVKETGYSNRSEFIRDMIRDMLVEKKWKNDQVVVGTITLVYDHHARRLSEKLTDLQHDHHDEVLATTHVHLDHHTCVEMILVKGRAKNIKLIADKLGQQKGVFHYELSMSAIGDDLK